MSSASFLQLGENRYFPARQKLLNNHGQELKLRPQSLAVLDLLASDPGEVVSKDEIFKTVWPNVSVTDDSLVQCIADIRRVLGDDNREILKTMPRRGYVLQAGKCFRDSFPVETDSKVNRWEDISTTTSNNTRDSTTAVALSSGSHKAFSILNVGKINKSAFGFLGLVALFAAIWVFRGSDILTGGSGNIERSEVMTLEGSRVGSVMPRFIDNGEGVVFDRHTNILWKKCSEGLSGENCEGGKIKKHRWDDAMKLNDSMWRLPSIDELRTLVYCDNNVPADEALDKSCVGAENKGGEFSRPTINSLVFPNTGAGRYWSSTAYRFDFEAWVVSFYEGRHSALNKKELRRVRLVRRNSAPEKKSRSVGIPSIAVLPFKNLTDKPRWGRVAEGLSTEIADELARNHWLFISAPTSFMEQSVHNTDPALIGRELGHHFVLSGSVQAEGDRLRISVRMTDVPDGKIVWAERWERPATAIFAVQDEILQKVEATINGAWTGVVAKQGMVKARNVPTSSLDAYELFLLGTEYKHKFTPEDDEIAASYFNQAVAIDPAFSKAWATLAVLRANQSVSVAGKAKRNELAGLRQLAALQAYKLNPSDSDVLLQYSWLKARGGEFAPASEAVHQAVSLSPNNPDILAHAAWVAALRNPESKKDGLSWGAKAIELSAANTPSWYRAGMGIAAFHADELQLSLYSLKQAPPIADVLIHRAAAAALLGNMTEATKAFALFKQFIPSGFSVHEYCELNAMHESSCARLISGAQLAGLPIGGK